MTRTHLIVRGARQHNLKSIDVALPRNKLIVITGLSGSGKSSLAFDTIYAEGQRRYVESLSAYARQFLEIMQKPDLDYIDGLSPAISIEQKTTARNPRSTVATVTEIYDYMRLLWARVGVPYSPATGAPIHAQTVSMMVDRVMAFPKGTRAYLLAPVVRGRKGEYRKELGLWQKQGFTRVRIDGTLYDIADTPVLDRKYKHDIEIIVDRIIVRSGLESRLADSFETALRLADGLAYIDLADTNASVAAMPDTLLDTSAAGDVGEAGAVDRADGVQEALAQEAIKDTPQAAIKGAMKNVAIPSNRVIFSEKFACPISGFTIAEIEPRLFSFNAPQGACSACDGLGERMEFTPELIVPNPALSLAQGAIAPWSKSTPPNPYYMHMLSSLGKAYKFRLNVPWQKLTDQQQQAILYGSGDRVIEVTFPDDNRGDHPDDQRDDQRHYSNSHYSHSTRKIFAGVVGNLNRRILQTDSAWMREELEKYQSARPCETCHGARLKPEPLAVKIAGDHISQATQRSVADALAWFGTLAAKLTDQQRAIADVILKEIIERLGFLNNVGLDYLHLDRKSGTLSGGESQRIRLASQIGSGLSGVLYVLDEPSIGLHQRDNGRLLTTLKRLRDLGNTVIVVEHDEEAIRNADYIVDMGPGAGVHGGTVVAAGTLKQILKKKGSLTAAYLNGTRSIAVPQQRRRGNGAEIVLSGARANNLKNVTVVFPLGVFICVTGLSGSGKSSLVIDTLYAGAARALSGARMGVGGHESLTGLEQCDKIIEIDQSPIGRTPRSNPATYTGAFTVIRDWFAGLPEAKARGYKSGRFSFNVKGGRCESCRGDGLLKIEMHFLPDVYVTCEICRGRRYNRETLEVLFKNKSIADVLNMTVEDASQFFKAVPAIRDKMQMLERVGLGYIKVGQQATTLSGGEAQRVKLSKELSRRSTGRTLYILDEPTTGLHFEDVRKLLEVLHALVEQGNSVIVIEHNLDVIKTADWVIDLGREGGVRGGEIIAAGTPETIAATERSYTGQYLKPLLDTQSLSARG